ncbi:MAG TPA: DUF1820 family protein, partial [Vicinamibacteria bacterium]
YGVIFHYQDNVYEPCARRVGQGELYTFVEVEDIIFGERGNLLVDPSEGKLKSEFAGVARTFITLPSVVRIDECGKRGGEQDRPRAAAAGKPAKG